MLRGIGEREGTLRAGPELRAVVGFSQVNLHDPDYAVRGSFDLIFCRNVLIYFEPAERQRVVERLAARLSPGGRLYLGHAESVRDGTGRLSCVGATTYVHVPRGPEGQDRKET
jgi:chemotaxis protein methyltransferase CheR